jgi:hypothetical protein
VKGQARLGNALQVEACEFAHWNGLPGEWPSHQDKPYAFKAYALKDVVDHYYHDLLLWADSSILPIRSLEPLWERIERDGYWFSRNGWNNYEWTADSAYPDLFPSEGWGRTDLIEALQPLPHARTLNRTIPHVVATTFGINVRHPKGRAFLDEYYRLASETRAFCGPWINSNQPGIIANPPHCSPCGPAGVRGHRHDQTAASVIAWRLGFELTDPPNIFAYKGGETADTILVADGGY